MTFPMTAVTADEIVWSETQGRYNVWGEMTWCEFPTLSEYHVYHDMMTEADRVVVGQRSDFANAPGGIRDLMHRVDNI